MRGNIAAALAVSALSAMVAGLVALPDRLLGPERVVDGLAVPTTATGDSSVEAALAPVRPATPRVAAIARFAAEAAAAPAPRRVHVRVARFQRTNPAPARAARPATPTGRAAEPRVAPQPTDTVPPQTEPTPQPTPTPAPEPATPHAARSESSARADASRGRRAESNGRRWRDARDASTAERTPGAPQYGDAADHEAPRSSRRPGRDRVDGLRHLAQAAGEAAPPAARRDAQARSEDRGRRGETRDDAAPAQEVAQPSSEGNSGPVDNRGSDERGRADRGPDGDGHGRGVR